MKVISLQSGSNGNCIYVEANGVKLLFDAGISGILVEERLALLTAGKSQYPVPVYSNAWVVEAGG